MVVGRSRMISARSDDDLAGQREQLIESTLRRVAVSLTRPSAGGGSSSRSTLEHVRGRYTQLLGEDSETYLEFLSSCPCGRAVRSLFQPRHNTIPCV